jgi:hypothetical protein
MRHAMGIITLPADVDCDVDCDGSVTATDAILVMRSVMNM